MDLIALGTIEHFQGGRWATSGVLPRSAAGHSMAVITVTYGNPLRKVVRSLLRPLLFLKANPFLRRMLNKPKAGEKFH